MKIYSRILIGLLIQAFMGEVAFGQTKKSSDSIFVNSQIKPKFSEMSDYGLPVSREGVHEFPGGKAPVSNQINPDGSIKTNKTGEITVPVETFRSIEIQKTKGSKIDSNNKIKSKN